MKKVSLLVTTVIFSAFGMLNYSQAFGETKEAGSLESNPTVEVLAQSKTQDGLGEIKILRHPDDGVSIVRIFPIGYRYELPRAAIGLSSSDQLFVIYRDLTGKELPLVAYEAVQKVEREKARNAALEVSEVESLDVLNNNQSEPSAASCGNTHPEPGNYFSYDCYIKGAISRTEWSDDVCLLVAAIDGNVSMQISYWSGTFQKYYNNYKVDVKEGHYHAVQLLTGVKRYRKGHIYNASATDYSRYAYNGDRKLVDLNTYGLSDCEIAASN